MNLQSKFCYCIFTKTLIIELCMRYEITDRQTDRRTNDPITRCPRRTFQAGGIKSLWPTDPNILSWKHTGQWNVTGNTFFWPYHNNNNKLLAHRNIQCNWQHAGLNLYRIVAGWRYTVGKPWAGVHVSVMVRRLNTSSEIRPLSG